MNGDAICGFRISVYCATNARASFYADPFHHMCSYHGVETDLLNLTACFGYELWRVSTTCTLVFESVKAGSVIFLLGIGSYVCYKLYRSYKRRCCPPDSPKRKVSRWISKELLESCLNREEDVLDVKPEYFGPADQSDDNTSGSEFGGLPISFLPNSSYCLNKSIAERLIHKISAKRMGHAQSSSRSCEPVSYNVRRGVNLFHKTSPLPVGLATIPSSSSPSPSIVCRNHHSLIKRSNDEKMHNPAKVMRPRSLSLHKKTRTSQKEADGSSAFEHLSNSVKGTRQLDDESSDSGESSHNWGSSRFYSDEEDNNGDGDDEGEEDEDCLDLSIFNFCKENDQGSCSGSLKGNFSPGSLLNRHLEMFSSDNRLPPDGTEDVARKEDAFSTRKKVFVIQSSNSASPDDDDSYSSELEKRDVINYKGMHFTLDSDNSKTTSQISPHRLVRDFSFGSECSELSVDTSAFNAVGRSTEAKINRIQKEIDDMKKDFQDMESHIGGVDFHGPIPTAYTELVKSTLSDISECSDGPACESPTCSRDGKSSVDYFKRRAVVKETLSHENLSPCHKLLSFRSGELSFDQSSTSSSSQLVNSSANLSFEWDSMKCGSNNNNSNTSIRLRKRWALSNGPVNSSMISNNSTAQADSGSDFGTPLTNGSPEPASRGRSGSVISLEWEEEFDPPISAEADNEISSSSLPGQNGNSLNQKIRQDEESLVSPTKYYANENNREMCMADSVHTESTFNPTTNGKHMWSSIESGYIDEFIESCGSCQITPLKDDETKTLGNSNCILDIRKHPNADSAYFESVLAEADHVRTWPVVEKMQEIKEQDGLSKEFVRQCRHLGFHHLRPIYKDGHSVFRAVLLQMLSHGYSPLVHGGGLDQVKRKFSLWMRCHHPWLSKWQFTPKLNYSQENCLQGMLDCLQTLDWLISCVLNSTNKEQAIVDMLNMDPEVEMQTMEACKLLIMKSVVELYDDLKVDKTVPVFALILFARESSMDPESYMCNHLNCIWNAGGPEEMDLFFLSHAMGVAISVLHPGNKDQDDMITYHPDDKIGSWPEIHLVFKKEKKQYCTILR